MKAARVFGGTCSNRCTVNTFGIGGVRVVRKVVTTTGRGRSPIVLRTSRNTQGCTNRRCVIKLVGVTLRSCPRVPATLRLSRNSSFRVYGTYVSNKFASIVCSNSGRSFRGGMHVAGRIMTCTRSGNIMMRTRLKHLTNMRSLIDISTGSTVFASPSRTTRFIRLANYSSLTVTVNADRNTCGCDKRPCLSCRHLRGINRLLPSCPVILRNTSAIVPRFMRGYGRFKKGILNTGNMPRSVLHGTTRVTIYGVGVSASVHLTVATTVQRDVFGGPRGFSPHKCLGPTERTMERVIVRGVRTIINSTGAVWCLRSGLGLPLSASHRSGNDFDLIRVVSGVWGSGFGRLIFLCSSLVLF